MRDLGDLGHGLDDSDLVDEHGGDDAGAVVDPLRE